MAKNKIADLRDHLFETLEALKDPDKPMDVKRAQAISSVAQAIIGSAKLEVQYLKLMQDEDGRTGSSEFLAPATNGKHLTAPEPAPKGLSTGKVIGGGKAA